MPRHHRAEAGQVGRVEVGLEHHAQRGGHEAGGGRAVAADRVDPALDREPLEQRERPAVADALQHPEQAAEVDERRVDDGDARAQAGRRVLVGLVVLGAGEDALEGVVGEVDALRRPGRAAGEHAHRDAGSARRRRWRRRSGRRDPGRDLERQPRSVDRDPGRPGVVGDEGGEVGGVAGDRPARSRAAMSARVRSTPRPGLIVTTQPPARSTPSRSADRGGPVAQQDADLGARVARPARRPARRSSPSSPQVCQRALELDAPARRGRWRAPRRCGPARPRSRGRGGGRRQRSLGSVRSAAGSRPPRPCRSGCRRGCRSGPARMAAR